MSITYTIAGGMVHLSGNPIKLILNTSVSRNNQKLAVKITCSTLFGSPLISEITPDIYGNATFDISGFFDQHINPEFTYPAVGVVNAHPTLSFSASLDIGEIYTDNAGDRQESWNNQTPANHTITVLKGQLRPHELAILNESSQSFYSVYIAGGKFLTHLPDKLRVAPDQLVKLWYLSRWATNHNANWNLSIATNLKIAHVPKLVPFIFYSSSGLIEFNVNPWFMGFSIAVNELIISYTFWLSDDTGDISERRTFLVDNNHFEKPFFLYYLNKFSVVDSIWFTGLYKQNLVTQSETAIRNLPYGYFTKTGSQVTVSGSGQQKWTINTGAKSQSEMLAIRDFLESSERWLVDPLDPNRLYPVIVESGDFELYDSMSDIPNLTLNILEAHL